MSIEMKFKNSRERLGLSQEEFGRLFGVSHRTIMRWEQGKSLPTQDQADILNKIASVREFPEENFLKKAIIAGGVAYGIYKLLQLVFEDKDPLI